MGEYYGYHYNQPNLRLVRRLLMATTAYYWFTYGNALFLMLNSNTGGVPPRLVYPRRRRKDPTRSGERELPHSVYSEASHLHRPRTSSIAEATTPQSSNATKSTRPQGPRPLLHPDLPDAGRQAAEGPEDELRRRRARPGGTLYLTFNREAQQVIRLEGFGSEVFSAVRWQGQVPSFATSRYRAARSRRRLPTDDMSVVDSYSIVKTK